MTTPNLIDIFIDEAGNTGQDLLNGDQKVFVLASNNFSTEQAKVLASLFPDKSEIHFKKLKNSNEGRKAIVDFINHPLITEKNIHCSTVHKEYTTVAQIVDQLIEPVLYKAGIDLYQYGQNIALTNFIIHFGNFFWDKAIYLQMLESFIEMMRTGEEKSINKFYTIVQNLYDSLKTKEKVLIGPILVSKKQIKRILQSVNKFTMDVTLSCFYVLCDYWHKNTHKKLRVFQDSSKQIEYYKEYIDFTRTLNIPKQDVGFDSRRLTFPTQIEEITLVNSESFLGVQISDLIASSLAFMYSNKNEKQNKFVEQIQYSKLLQLSNYHTVWPNSAITPEELKMDKGEGQNILDFLADHKLKKDI
jgi:hypothetical protein